MNFILTLFLIVMSLIAFIVMGIDKRKAKLHKHRISEKTLWILAIIGGGIGSYFGMMFFRHKTKHLNFRIGFFLLAVLDVIFIVWVSLQKL